LTVIAARCLHTALKKTRLLLSVKITLEQSSHISESFGTENVQLLFTINTFYLMCCD